MASEQLSGDGSLADRQSASIDEKLLLWADRHLQWLLVLPALIILVALTLYPLLRAVKMSLYEFARGRKIFVGLGNYLDLLSNGAFHHSLWVTFKFVILAVGIEFLLGFGIALLLNKKIKLRGFWQTVFLVPMILSPTVVGLVWRLLYAPSGLLNQVLTPILGHSIGWLTEPSIALYSIIILDVWEWTPLIVLVMFAGLQSIPDDLREAAIMDGASRWQRFFDITLPYLKSLIVLVVIIRVVDALRMFAPVYVMTRGGPASATNIISMYLYRVAFRFHNLGEAAAMGLSLLVIVIIASIAFIKFTNIEF